MPTKKRITAAKKTKPVAGKKAVVKKTPSFEKLAVPVETLRQTIGYFFALSYIPPATLGEFTYRTTSKRSELASAAGMESVEYFRSVTPEVCRRMVAFHQASREPDAKLVESLVKKALVLDENPLTDKDKGYIIEVLEGVQNNLPYIDKTVEKHSKDWKIGRISKIDLSIMRLSIYEICFRNDIPYSVSVNEAVELAKKYSNEDAGSFVNGILSKVSKVEVLPVNQPDGG